uniref:Uncharacterized protein n=1 Tax=Lepeophtheirus salmonis TaxID=72036 RepID=A0A0K2V0C4_LEPSM
MNRLVKQHLNLNAYKRNLRQSLKPLDGTKHVTQSKILLIKLEKQNSWPPYSPTVSLWTLVFLDISRGGFQEYNTQKKRTI